MPFSNKLEIVKKISKFRLLPFVCRPFYCTLANIRAVKGVRTSSKKRQRENKNEKQRKKEAKKENKRKNKREKEKTLCHFAVFAVCVDALIGLYLCSVAFIAIVLCVYMP